MRYIVGYRKAYDAHTTYRLALPDGCEATELCTVDGITYVSVPDGAVLPEQPPEIAASVAVVVPDAALREAIKTMSPHCGLIKMRGHQRVIDAGYSLEDQRKLDRLQNFANAGAIVLSAGQQAALAAFVSTNLAADQWASEQYAGLGL